MQEPLIIRADVIVPPQAMSVSAVRSSGPGGQNVNKVSSKIDLRVDLGQVTGLTYGARARLLRLVATKLDSEGRLQVVSQKTRDQWQNLDDARDKVRSLIAQALIAPTPRRPTKPSRGATERRLNAKKQTSDRKASRRGGHGFE